jgi:ferric enterobactin receptor
MFARLIDIMLVEEKKRRGLDVRKYLVVLILTVFFTHDIKSQKVFAFNNPGNVCYFHYLCYTQNQNYVNVRRPFVFIYGKPGESALELFEKDSIKNLPHFYDYEFVYIPGSELNVPVKQECVVTLAGMLTYNYAIGTKNLFLQVTDPSITTEDVKNSGLSSVFKSIRLNDKAVYKDSIVGLGKITDDFHETIIEEEVGNYDDGEGSSSTAEIEKPKKTYFGDPKNFNFTLSGIVRDRQTGEGLPFATVQIRGINKGVTTNIDGYFTLVKVPSDTSVLVVQYVGYQKMEVYLTPETAKRNLLIQLSAANNLKEVVITAAREDVVIVNQTDVSTIKMTPKKLEQLPNIGERDVMRSFQLMPGVSASNESSSGLYVRGGTPDQNLILYDGFTIYQVDHLYGFFSAFNSNALKDVQLYKGGFESRFGGRLSSVTEITGKDGNQKKVNAGVDLSLLSANAFVEVPIGSKFSSIIAVRRSYKGFVYNTIFDKFNSSANSATNQGNNGGGFRGRAQQQTQATSYFYDLNGKFTYRPTSRDIISLSIFNGTDKLDNSSNPSASTLASGRSFNINTTDLTKYGNFGSSLKHSRKWSPNFYGNTIISYSNYYSNRDRSQQRTITDASGASSTFKSGILENNNLKDYSFKSDYQWDVFNWAQLQFGAFASYYDIKYTYSQNDTTTILNKHDMSTLAGGYLQSKIKLFGEKVQILPGIRASYFNTTQQTYYEPRASLVYNITRRISLKGAYGKFYQFANRITREDILSGSRDFWVMSNGTNIPVSSALHYIAGISVDLKNYLFSAEGYYKKLNGLTEYSLRFNTSPSGINYNENFYTGTGYARGVEFLVQKKTGKLTGWISYTLGQARNHFDVYSTTDFPAAQDVTHEFHVVAIYTHKRWNFSATWIYATGRPYTAPSGAYQVTLLDGTTQDFFTVTSKNSLRLPDYHRMDLAVNYKIVVGDGKKRREVGYIGFSIFNVYNRVNVWYKTYSIADGQIVETNVNYLGFVPNLTLSLKLR